MPLLCRGSKLPAKTNRLSRSVFPQTSFRNVVPALHLIQIKPVRLIVLLVSKRGTVLTVVEVSGSSLRCFDFAIIGPSLRVPPCPADDAQAGEAQEVTGNGKPEMDGWLVYDEEAEFVRQGVIRPTSLDS